MRTVLQNATLAAENEASQAADPAGAPFDNPLQTSTLTNSAVLPIRRGDLGQVAEVLGLYKNPHYAEFWQRHNSSPHLSLAESLRQDRQRHVSTQTYWTRDSHTLTFLGDHCIPRASTGHPLRVASVGCSAGIEPYSLLFLNWAGRERIEISGFDVNPEMLALAREGVYPLWIDSGLGDLRFFENLPELCHEEAFTIGASTRKEYLTMTVNPAARARVALEEADILERPLPRTQDLIFVRHLMGHLSQQGQRVCAENLYESLNPGGCVVLNTPLRRFEDRAETLWNLRRQGFEIHCAHEYFGAQCSRFFDDQVACKPAS